MEAVQAEIHRTIKEILEYHSRVLPPFLQIEHKGLQNRLSVTEYIYAMYQALIHLTESNPEFQFGPASVILKMLGLDSICTAVISLHFETTNGALLFARVGPKGSKEYSMKGEMVEFTRALWNELDSSCMFAVFDLDLFFVDANEAHQNLLIIYRSDNVHYHLGIYDPHGTAVAHNIETKQIFLTQLCQQLRQLLPEFQFTALEFDQVGCPVGLQSVTGEKIGYCVMFSYFWIYCVLRCLPLLKMYPAINFASIELAILEQSISPNEYLQKPNYLMNIVMNFAVAYCSFFLENNREEITEALLRDTRKEIRREKFSIMKLDETKRAMEGVNEYKEEKSLLNDGSPCGVNEECQSQCCVQGRCQPLNLNSVPATFFEFSEVTLNYQEFVEDVFRDVQNSIRDNLKSDEFPTVEGYELFDRFWRLMRCAGFANPLIPVFQMQNANNQMKININCIGEINYSQSSVITANHVYSVTSHELVPFVEQLLSRMSFICRFTTLSVHVVDDSLFPSDIIIIEKVKLGSRVLI